MLGLLCSLIKQRKVCESTDQSCGGKALAEPAQALEPVETCREKPTDVEPADSCRENLAEASLSSSPLPTCLADNGLVAALPALLPLRSLLAAECVTFAMPSFDTLHRVSTEIARPRRAARLGIAPHPRSSHGRLLGIMRCAPADEANC